MDPERETRQELIRLLGPAFSCSEEARLRTPSSHDVRCDVLAIPRDAAFAGHPLAFECKRPSQDWHYAPWAKAIHQASDYVGAEVVGTGGVVSAAFLFPAPMAAPNPGGMLESELVRPGYELAVAGMFHLALFYRVGRAGWKTLTNVSQFCLALGPNEIWKERPGFTRNAQNLLLEGRPVGSRNRPYSPSG